MKTRPAHQAFTLLELMTVLAVIVILTAMVVGVAGLVQNKSAKARAKVEIQMITTALDRYKGDNGTYPRTDKTDELSPMFDLQPTKGKYAKASIDLYKELTGDNKEPYDGVPEPDTVAYLKEFDQRILKKTTSGVGSSQRKVIEGFQDPFGFIYGYSTAGAASEADYLAELRKDSDTPRPKKEDAKGYNVAGFDMWSTGGSNPSAELQGAKAISQEHAKWEKNW